MTHPVDNVPSQQAVELLVLGLGIIQANCNHDYYFYSFFPRAIKDWNSLPSGIRTSTNFSLFKDHCFSAVRNDWSLSFMDLFYYYLSYLFVYIYILYLLRNDFIFYVYFYFIFSLLLYFWYCNLFNLYWLDAKALSINKCRCRCRLALSHVKCFMGA